MSNYLDGVTDSYGLPNPLPVGLAQLASLKNLKSLGLDSTFVTDKSREVLLNLKTLESLNLYHTTVTAKVEEEIKNGLPGCRITWDEKSGMPNRRRS